MNCWKCSKSLDDTLKIGFRTVCSYCDADLHVCINCKYYAPGKPHDCIVPGTENVTDKERGNFCEEYEPKPASCIINTKKKFTELFK